MRLLRFSVFLLFLFSATGGLFAQSLSRAQLLTDLRFLENAVRAARPSAAQDGSLDSLTNLLKGLECQIKKAQSADSISPFQYRLAVGMALQAVGDGHMLVLKNPRSRVDSFYFPLPVALVDKKLFLLRQCPEYPADLVGKEITSINGIRMAAVLADLFCYAAADGGGTHFAEGIVRINLIPLITAYFDGPRSYRVEADGRTLDVEAIRTVRAGEARHPMLGAASKAALRRGDNALHLRAIDSTAILVVTAFAKKDKAFFRAAFSEMEKVGTSRLVIDLRGNTGGSRRAAAALAKHFVDIPFGYSLVRPRGQRLRPFLNRQGRTFLSLARVKYGVGSFHRAHTTSQGRAVHYRYKPASSLYSGRLAVLTDGLTFSSSTMVTSWLKQYSHAFFVGSQAGGGYNGNWGGSFTRITLPQSGMVVQMPAYRLVLDETSTQRDGIMPNLSVQPTINDVLTHRDFVLDTALNAISGAPWATPGIHLSSPTTP